MKAGGPAHVSRERSGGSRFPPEAHPAPDRYPPGPDIERNEGNPPCPASAWSLTAPPT